MIPTDTDLWEDLLLAIEDGHVVPVVGRDLLVVDTAGGPRLFQQIVAEQLADDLKIPRADLPAVFGTHDVVCAYKGFHGDPTSISPRVVRILRGLSIAPPESLRLLARIPQFKLFVSTSFDNLLEDAIQAERGRAPATIAFPPVSSLTDLDEGLFERQGSVVFHMLGKASASAPFALTEGQMLEQMHELMAGPRRPERLMARLRESHLLLLGVGFPDWLQRFLLRDSRAKPLWDSRSMMEVVAEDRASDVGLSQFLRHFSPQQTRVFTAGSPADFVRELHRRWFERHPAAGEHAAAPPGPSEKPVAMAAGSIFISYASEDRDAAFRLTDALVAAGLDAWVDRRISPGDDYRNLIERQIRECCAFVPVLSRHTQTDDERWFRKEWAQACDRARALFGTDRAFLFPVVVDGTSNADLNELRHEIFGTSAVRAPEGAPPPPLVEQLDRAQKAWRKQHAAA